MDNKQKDKIINQNNLFNCKKIFHKNNNNNTNLISTILAIIILRKVLKKIIH